MRSMCLAEMQQLLIISGLHLKVANYKLKQDILSNRDLYNLTGYMNLVTDICRTLKRLYPKSVD